ncbi:hypothetical protein KIPB_009907, partial [Kipferlia bialata]|eukprot:g9907.t1
MAADRDIGNVLGLPPPDHTVRAVPTRDGSALLDERRRSEWETLITESHMRNLKCFEIGLVVYNILVFLCLCLDSGNGEIHVSQWWERIVTLASVPILLLGVHLSLPKSQAEARGRAAMMFVMVTATLVPPALQHSLSHLYSISILINLCLLLVSRGALGLRRGVVVGYVVAYLACLTACLLFGPGFNHVAVASTLCFYAVVLVACDCLVSEALLKSKQDGSMHVSLRSLTQTTLAVFFNALPPALYRTVANNQRDALVQSVGFTTIAFLRFVPSNTTCGASQHIA